MPAGDSGLGIYLILFFQIRHSRAGGNLNALAICAGEVGAGYEGSVDAGNTRGRLIQTMMG